MCLGFLSSLSLQSHPMVYETAFLGYNVFVTVFCVPRGFSYSRGVMSPGRHVRTRLYFTSESHVHSLLSIFRYGGLLDVRMSPHHLSASDLRHSLNVRCKNGLGFVDSILVESQIALNAESDMSLNSSSPPSLSKEHHGCETAKFRRT